MKQVINEALRRGLSAPGAGGRRQPYRVLPHDSEIGPGLDLTGFNRLADELEDEAVVAKAARDQ